MIVGSMSEARTIFQAKMRPGFYGLSYVYSDADLPKGWSRLGGGAYRTVFAAPSGCAYKLQRDDYDRGGNVDEYRNLTRLHLEGIGIANVRLPEFTYYEMGDGWGVLAMERIQGQTVREWESSRNWPGTSRPIMRELDRSGLTDMHEGNVMIEDSTGMYVVVDLGL